MEILITAITVVWLQTTCIKCNYQEEQIIKLLGNAG